MDISTNPFAPQKLEWAYGVAIKKLDERETWWPLNAMRAAKRRDPSMMRALDKCAETMLVLQESLNKDVRRLAEFAGGQREATEHQMFRNAFQMADEGCHEGMEPYIWIYGAVGLLCGFSER